MTKFVDTGRPGKKRYRVRWQGIGGSRTAEFADPCDAYREFYLRERRLWEDGAESAIDRKRPITLKALMMFYFGGLCEKYEFGNISLGYFRPKKRIFEKLLDLWRNDRRTIIDMDASDFNDIMAHNHRVFIRQAYKLAIEVGICRRNPCRVQNKHKKAAWKGSVKKYATQDEVKALMQLPDPRVRLAVYLGAACGMRVGEVAALRWENVRQNEIIIDSHLTVIGIQTGLKYGVDNCLPVSAEFYRLLAEVPRGASKYVFESQRKTHFSESGFQKAVTYPALRSVRMDKAGKGFHSLRHYAVSVWVRRGIPVTQISRWLDHASPEITLRTYAHLFERSEDYCYLFEK